MKWMPPLVLGCFAILVHISIYFSGLYIPVGDFHDPDCYMRLVQIQDLLEQSIAGWSDHMIDRDNAPYGSETHWSRAVDLGILTLYFPLRLLLTTQDALYLSGLIFSTLLLMPCLILIDRVVREFLTLEGRLLTMLIFLVQPGILNYFALARPDHHALILTCFISSICLGMMALKYPNQLRYLLAGAVCVSLGLWTSVESMITWLILTLCFTLSWLVNHLSARSVATFHTTTWICSLSFLLLETPKELFQVHSFDRLSGVHILMLGLVTLCWWLLTLVQGNSYKRLSVSAVLGITAMAIWFAAFPEALSGPFGKVAPELKTLWLDHVQELHPLGTSPLSMLMGILAWIPAMIPGLFIFRYLYQKKGDITKVGWVLWGAWLVAMSITTLLAIYQKRWIAYAGIAWTPAAAFCIYLLLARIKHISGFRVYRALILLLLCTGPTFLSLIWENKQAGMSHSVSISPSMDEITPDVASNSLPEFLANSLKINQPGQIIMCFIDQGPEILYRTTASVMASPYHRNNQGIIDAHTALSASDDTIALDIVNRRNIQWVITGSNQVEASYYGTDDSLYQKLCNNQPPEWLKLHESILTPMGIYHIYRTRPAVPSPQD